MHLLPLLMFFSANVLLPNEYNYCKPHNSTESHKSFIEFKGIRHCLIEHLKYYENYMLQTILSLGR